MLLREEKGTDAQAWASLGSTNMHLKQSAVVHPQMG
jgi:hypothetical protein